MTPYREGDIPVIGHTLTYNKGYTEARCTHCSLHLKWDAQEHWQTVSGPRICRPGNAVSSAREMVYWQRSFYGITDWWVQE